VTAAAWKTYTPDGRELAVEHVAEQWVATCAGKRGVGATAHEAIATAVGHEDASIGTAEAAIEAWVTTQAAQLESELGAA
jgi:hypothetical protein